MLPLHTLVEVPPPEQEEEPEPGGAAGGALEEPLWRPCRWRHLPPSRPRAGNSSLDLGVGDIRSSPPAIAGTAR